VATVVGDEVRSGRWPRALFEPLDGLFPEQPSSHRSTGTKGTTHMSTAVASHDAMSADERTYRDLANAYIAQAELHDEWADKDRVKLAELDGHENDPKFVDRMDELVDNIQKHKDAGDEFRGKARAAVVMADRAAAAESPE
jgi:hypothetical protein